MFALRKPCVNCPFRKDQGPLFGLPSGRLNEIMEGVSFEWFYHAP